MRLSWLLVLALAARPAAAQEVSAVLSSELPVYRQAFEAFAAVLGTTPALVPLARRPDVPAATRVVAAFGTAAARARYPEGVVVIAVAAPGLEWERTRPGVSVVRMVPRPRELVARAGALGVRRLGLAYMAPGLAPYAAAVVERARAAGLEVRTERLESLDDLPDVLRGWRREVDAVWLPPDPALVTPRSVLLVSKFAQGAGIPFFGPTEAFAEEGASFGLGVSPAAMGRAAADAAGAALAGTAPEAVLYPEEPAPALVPPVADSDSLREGRAR